MLSAARPSRSTPFSLALGAVPRDRHVYHRLVLTQDAFDQRDVSLPDAAIGPLSLQRSHRGIVLRHTITPDVSLSSRWTIPVRSVPLGDLHRMMANRIYQRPRLVTRAGCTTIPAALFTTITSSSS